MDGLWELIVEAEKTAARYGLSILTEDDFTQSGTDHEEAP